MTVCDEALRKGLEKLDQATRPLIEQTAGIVMKMQARGLNPRTFYDAKNDAVIDMVQLLADLTGNRISKEGDLRRHVEQNCTGAVDAIQNALDNAIALFTSGLSEVLPAHMTHIDVGTILAGYPLGGDNSVFNQLRDDIFFKSIGIDADSALGKAISNPFAGSNFKDGLNQLLGNLGLPFRL